MAVWKAIAEFPMYEVSDDGQVRFVGGMRRFGSQMRYAPPCLRSLAEKKNGYLQVTLSGNGRSKNFYVHRLVGAAFVPNENNLPVINHKDGNRKNNCADNLEWVTHSQNTQHAIDALGSMIGERHSQARLTAADVTAIRMSDAPPKVLGPKYGVTATHIVKIRRRETWKHLPEVA